MPDIKPAVICLAVLLASAPRIALAQGSEPAQIDEIRRRIEALEQRMQQEIAALRAELAARESMAGVQRPTAPQPAPSQPAPSAVDQGDTFSRDRESVARVNNVPPEAVPQGFLSIPGTPARMKVDGYAKLDTIVDGKPAGNTDQFVPSSIPVGLADSLRTASTTMHIRQTRLNLDFRSPTELGEFRSFAEFDFYGSSGPVDPRMRHFYGQLANVLLGQTWTTFTDVDAFPDTLDFSGPVGMSVLRQAQLRYTHPLATGQSLAVAIERPLTQAPAIGANGAAYNPAPDVIARYRIERTRGHLQAGSVFRSLGYRVASRNTTELGVGFNVAGAVKPLIGKDVLLGSLVYGTGIARYIDNLAGINADLDLDDSGTDVATLPALGWYVGYTHHWSAQFRSTGAFGYSAIDNTAAQQPSAFRSSRYFSSNLLWNPAGSLNVGIEYLYGTHELKSRDSEHASRLQFAAKDDLF